MDKRIEKLRKQLEGTTMSEPTSGYFARLRANTERTDHNDSMKSAHAVQKEGSLGRNSSFKKMPFDVELFATNRYLRAKLD